MLARHFALRASLSSLLCFPDKKPKRILRLPFRHYISDPAQCIDGIQVSQHLPYRQAVSVVFCKHACFDEFRHKVLGRDFTDGWVAGKVLLNDGIDLGCFILERQIRAFFFYCNTG